MAGDLRAYIWYYCCLALPAKNEATLRDLGEFLKVGELFRTREPANARSKIGGFSTRAESFWVRPYQLSERLKDSSGERWRFLYPSSGIAADLARFVDSQQFKEWRERERSRLLTDEEMKVMRAIAGADVPRRLPYDGVVLFGSAAERDVTWLGVRHNPSYAKLTPAQISKRLRYHPDFIVPAIADRHDLGLPGTTAGLDRLTREQFKQIAADVGKKYFSTRRAMIWHHQGAGIHEALRTALALIAEQIPSERPNEIAVINDLPYEAVEDSAFEAASALRGVRNLTLRLFAREQLVAFINAHPWLWSKYIGIDAPVKVIAARDEEHREQIFLAEVPLKERDLLRTVTHPSIVALNRAVRIPWGQNFQLIGPSGSGKTTAAYQLTRQRSYDDAIVIFVGHECYGTAALELLRKLIEHLLDQDRELLVVIDDLDVHHPADERDTALWHLTRLQQTRATAGQRTFDILVTYRDLDLVAKHYARTMSNGTFREPVVLDHNSRFHLADLVDHVARREQWDLNDHSLELLIDLVFNDTLRDVMEALRALAQTIAALPESARTSVALAEAQLGLSKAVFDVIGYPRGVTVEPREPLSPNQIATLVTELRELAFDELLGASRRDALPAAVQERMMAAYGADYWPRRWRRLIGRAEQNSTIAAHRQMLRCFAGLQACGLADVPLPLLTQIAQTIHDIDHAAVADSLDALCQDAWLERTANGYRPAVLLAELSGMDAFIAIALRQDVATNVTGLEENDPLIDATAEWLLDHFEMLPPTQIDSVLSGLAFRYGFKLSTGQAPWTGAERPKRSPTAQLLERIIQRLPVHGRARMDLAIRLIRARDTSVAISCVEPYFAANPTDLRSQVEFATALLNRNESAVIEALKRLLRGLEAYTLPEPEALFDAWETTRPETRQFVLTILAFVERIVASSFKAQALTTLQAILLSEERSEITWALAAAIRLKHVGEHVAAHTMLETAARHEAAKGHDAFISQRLATT